MFKRAGAAEIIRSYQKDDVYLSHLRSNLSDILQSLLGPRQWINWRKEIDLVSDFGYFFLTTFGGYQTIGEEYVNILQVDSSKRALPSKLRRMFMIIFHVSTPYCLNKLLEWSERYLKSSRSREIPDSTRTFLLRCIPALRQTVTILHRGHLALFYIFNVFYHISKRIMGVHYLKYDMSLRTGDNGLRKSFQILGCVSLVQLCGSILFQLYQSYKDSKKATPDFPSQLEDLEVWGSKYVEPSRKCSLCLEERKGTTATPCGHLFCWGCIHEWCQNKAQCPLCREKILPQSLIFLHNFDPPRNDEIKNR